MSGSETIQETVHHVLSIIFSPEISKLFPICHFPSRAIVYFFDTMAANGGMNKMMVMLPMMWMMGKINFEEGNILFYARIAFFTAQILQAAVALYIKMQVENTADKKTKILVPEAQPPSFSMTPPEEGATVPMNETTYYAHESAKVKELLTQCGMGACISTFIHFKFGVNQVVVIQSVMIPFNLFDQPLFKKYIRRCERVWDEKMPGEVAKTQPKKTLGKSESQEDFEPVLDAKGAIVNAWDHPTLENATLLFQMVKDTPNVVSAVRTNLMFNILSPFLMIMRH